MKKLFIYFAVLFFNISVFAQNIDIFQITNSEQTQKLDKVFRKYLTPENLTQAVVKNDYDSVKYFLRKNIKPEDLTIGYKNNATTYLTYLYCISSGPVKDLLTVKGAVPLFCPPITKNLENYVLQKQEISLPQYDETQHTPRELLKKNKLLSYIENGIISPDKIYKSFSKSAIYQEEDNNNNKSKYDLRYQYQPKGFAEDFIASTGDLKYLSLLKQANIKLSFEEFAEIEPRLVIFLSYNNVHYCQWLNQVNPPKFISKEKWDNYVEQVFCLNDQDNEMFYQKQSYHCINSPVNVHMNKILNSKYRHNIIGHIYSLTTNDEYADKSLKTITSDYNNIVSQRNNKENPYEKNIYENTIAITKQYINNKYH